MEALYMPVRNDIQRMLQSEKKQSMKWAIYAMLLFGKDQKKNQYEFIFMLIKSL